MIIDSHAHYSVFQYQNQFPYLDGNADGLFRNHGTRKEMFTRMREEGIAFCIEPSVHSCHWEAQLAVAKEYPSYIRCALGVHPKYCMETAWEERNTLSAYAKTENIVAIGEAGLDYSIAEEECSRSYQKEWFIFQIGLAHALRLPLILHIRNAHRDALEILEAHRDRLHGGSVHCFTGDTETALRYIRLGLALGIGGRLLHDNGEAEILKETVRNIPISSILAETDAPYVLPDLTDVQGSKKQKSKLRNTSLLLPCVIKEIARLRGESLETVEQAVFENTLRIFGLGESVPAFPTESAANRR